MRNPLDSINRNEFYTSIDRPVNSVIVNSISQNPYSVSLTSKSIFACNPQLIFLSSILNCFQRLDCFDKSDPSYYKGYTHALTIYCLKLLEKYGVIEIVSCEKSANYDLGYYYAMLGNAPKNSHVNMYNIVFYKKRSLLKDDEPMIEKMFKLLRVKSSDIKFYYNCDDELKARISAELYLKNLLLGKPFIQIFKSIYYYFKSLEYTEPPIIDKYDIKNRR